MNGAEIATLTSHSHDETRSGHEDARAVIDADRCRRRAEPLTRREAARLERGQNHVNRTENRALADGTISRGEFKRIERAQNVESRRIYHQKHDCQDRPNR